MFFMFSVFQCKVLILNGGEIILLPMALKQKNQSLSFNNLILVPQTSLRRETTSNKYKILPNLKSHNSETQVGKPIDFTYYGRLKKHNKLRPSTRNTSNLFMEGGAVLSIPQKQNKYAKTQMEQVGIRQNQLTRERIRQRLFLENQSLSTVQKIEKGVCSSEQKIWKPRRVTNFKNKTMQLGNPLLKEGQQTPEAKLYGDKPSVYLGRDELSQIKAQSFVVLQYPSLQVIASLRHRQGAQIASLTKIMTFFTVWELSKDLQLNLESCKYQIEEQDTQITGTSAGLTIGDQLTVQQLLFGLMLPSGNDAAISLAKWAANLIPVTPFKNSIDTFVARMNRMARLIGLRQSVFANPHGLPHRLGCSNPYQIALLVAKCMQIPLFRRVVGTKIYRAEIRNGGIKRTIIWENTNKLLGQQGFVGVKTGVTITAGPCLASCYQKGSKKFIVVLLRTSKLSRRFKQTKLILGWALRRYDPFSYGAVCKALLRKQEGLDSQSEDQQQFSYQKIDAQELARRNDILVYQL